MEIPASGRLFMGHRHVARIAVHAGRRSTHSIVRKPHDRPAGTTITGRPFTFLARLPWRSSMGRIAVSSIRVTAGAKEEERARRERVDLHDTHAFNKYGITSYEISKKYRNIARRVPSLHFYKSE